MKKYEPLPVDPFTLGRSLSFMSEAMDDLMMVSVGYKPSSKHAMENTIVRLLSVSRKQPNNKDLSDEVDSLISAYDKAFGWTNPA